MTLRQKLFFSLLFFLAIAAVAAIVANGVAIHYYKPNYKPDMLFPYIFVLLIVTAASAPNVLRAFQRQRLVPLGVRIPAPPRSLSR